jgi:hypothetical protein
MRMRIPGMVREGGYVGVGVGVAPEGWDCDVIELDGEEEVVVVETDKRVAVLVVVEAVPDRGLWDIENEPDVEDPDVERGRVKVVDPETEPAVVAVPATDVLPETDVVKVDKLEDSPPEVEVMEREVAAVTVDDIVPD